MVSMVAAGKTAGGVMPDWEVKKASITEAM